MSPAVKEVSRQLGDARAAHHRPHKVHVRRARVNHLFYGGICLHGDALIGLQHSAQNGQQHIAPDCAGHCLKARNVRIDGAARR